MSNYNDVVSFMSDSMEQDIISAVCGEAVADMYALYKQNKNLHFLCDALALSMDEVKAGISAAKAALEESDIESLIADLRAAGGADSSVA